MRTADAAPALVPVMARAPVPADESTVLPETYTPQLLSPPEPPVPVTVTAPLPPAVIVPPAIRTPWLSAPPPEPPEPVTEIEPLPAVIVPEEPRYTP